MLSIKFDRDAVMTCVGCESENRQPSWPIFNGISYINPRWNKAHESKS